MTALLIGPVLFAAPPSPASAADSGAARIESSVEFSSFRFSSFRFSPPTATPVQCALWKRVDLPRYRKYCV